MSAAFWLVVHPARPEPLVEVIREKRSVESCQQEVTEKDTWLRQCREENARLRTEAPLPEGLAALLDAGLMDQDGCSTRTSPRLSRHGRLREPS